MLTIELFCCNVSASFTLLGNNLLFCERLVQEPRALFYLPLFVTKQIRFVDGALEKYKLTTPIEPIVAIVLNIFLNDIQFFQHPCGTSAQIQLCLPTLKTVCNSFIQ